MPIINTPEKKDSRKPIDPEKWLETLRRSMGEEEADFVPEEKVESPQPKQNEEKPAAKKKAIKAVTNERVIIDISYKGETLRKECPNMSHSRLKGISELLLWIATQVEAKFLKESKLEVTSHPDLKAKSWGQIIDDIAKNEEKRYVQIKAEQKKRREARAKRREKAAEAVARREQRIADEKAKLKAQQEAKEAEEGSKKKENEKLKEDGKAKEAKAGNSSNIEGGDEKVYDSQETDREENKIKESSSKPEQEENIKKNKPPVPSEKPPPLPDKETESSQSSPTEVPKPEPSFDEKVIEEDGKELEKEEETEGKITDEKQDVREEKEEEEEEEVEIVSDDTAKDIEFESISVQLYRKASKEDSRGEHLVVSAPILYDTPEIGIVRPHKCSLEPTSSVDWTADITLRVRTFRGMKEFKVKLGTLVSEVKSILNKDHGVTNGFALAYPQLGILHPNMRMGDCQLPKDATLFIMPNPNPKGLENLHGAWYVDPRTRIKVNRLNPSHPKQKATDS